MDIEKLNRKHFVETDMYYRVGLGLSSKLLKFENGTIYLEIVIGKKWKKSYNATAAELAHCWKNTHPELSNAIACKAFIIDTLQFNYKQYLIHKGISPGYDAKKGIIFNKTLLN
ncbi:MAG: hypothetical protein V3V14_01745 [Saprospiraceae bacterium]